MGRRNNQRKRQRQAPVSAVIEHPILCGGDEGVIVSNRRPHRRNLSDLFTSRATYICATERMCIPCAYKIGCFDVALDTDFSTTVPNVRPELCPRVLHGATQEPAVSGRVMGYSLGMNVLTVGDGDFSYSLAVARILNANVDDAPNVKGRLVATSYERKETLLQVYPKIIETIQELQELGAVVCFEVDATALVQTLPTNVGNNRDKAGSCTRYDRIVWNFPCVALPAGQDAQNAEMEINRHLIQKFVSNASTGLLNHGGEIYITHKTKPPFDQWKLERVALDTVDPSMAIGIEYKGRIVLDRCMLPPYIPCKALDKRSFTCHDACVYIFGQGPRNDLDPAAAFSFPPTIPEPAFETEAGSTSIIPVTEEMLTHICKVHHCMATRKKWERMHGSKHPRKKKRHTTVDG